MPKISIIRKFTFSIALLFVALFVANCGGDTPMKEASQPAELNWVSLDVSSQVEETLAKNYGEEHPNITFKRQPLNFNQDYLTTTPSPDILMSFTNRA